MKTIKTSEETSYYIKRDENEIWGEMLISNQKIKDINEAELKEIVLNNDIDIFICRERSYLDKIARHEVTRDWDSHYKNHIAMWVDSIDHYKDGYGYFGELWQSIENKNIILLFYCD